MRIAVIGLGLIGGSIALAARERLDAETVGWDPDSEALDLAVRRGVLSERAVSLASALRGTDVAFVAAPVGVLPGLVSEALSAAPEDCVVSDVGSTKRSIVFGQDDQRFVGGHPLAGAETSGVEHARADLFVGATWYLTPTAITDGQLYERLHRLLGGLGAVPVALDAETHDRLLALVSHLPHVFANVLVAQAAAGSGEDGKRLPSVGPSFRDATRVAGSNSGIWTDIYMSNRDALVPALDEAIERLGRVRDALRAGDPSELTRWNDAAARDHQQLLQGHLSEGDLHELRIPVPNRPGVVAQIALELGRVGVNIADLGLYPASSMRDGVVALWLSGDENADRAQRAIEDLGFAVLRP
jgi:prephenate dehydrogenase